jgi:riboflavin synthase
MFTGIIECLGTLVEKKQDKKNIHLTIKSEISNELKIDQSIAHNGVCLTVINVEETRTQLLQLMKQSKKLTSITFL